MLRILFVDDQRVELDGMSQLLNWEEMGLEWAGGVTDAEEALGLVGREKIDIVVTDVIMQNMDGLTLVRMLKERYPLVRTVCISGFDDFKFVGTAINNGASGYVLKPILVNELKSVLERVTGEIMRERAMDKLTPGEMALLMLGAGRDGLDEALLSRRVRLCAGEKAPGEALAAITMESGEAYFVLPESAPVPQGARCADPMPLRQLREAYLALNENEAAQGADRHSRERAVERIKQNVEAHLAEEADTRALLEGVFLSSSQAGALFKNATGMSIHRYVVTRRLAEAARLLREEPEARVKDIAWRCGFADASHLINSFQKKYGMTPEKYRRRQLRDEADE